MLLGLGVLTTALSTGCAVHPVGVHAHYAHVHSSPGVALFATGVVVGALAADAAAHAQEEPPVTEVHVVYVNGPPGPPPVTPPSPADRIEPSKTIALDAPSARAALASADVQPCASEGAPAGYGHAKVTFAPAGNITKVIIDSPSGLTPEAVSCLGAALGTAEAPPFDGAPVTVGTTFLVK